MSRIAIVLPAYNEELTVAATMEDFHKELPTASIWVVNNRSTDATEHLAKSTFARLGCQGGVINESRPGKGNAVRRALLDIDADVYILADADLTYPASDVHALLKPVWLATLIWSWAIDTVRASMRLKISALYMALATDWYETL